MRKIKFILCVLGLSIGIAGCSEQKIEEPVLRPDESQVDKQKLVEEVDNTTEALEFLPDNDRVDGGSIM